MPLYSVRVSTLCGALTAGLLVTACKQARQVETHPQPSASVIDGSLGSKVPSNSSNPGPNVLSASGIVEGFRTVSVKSRIDGVITQVLFTEGSNVKEGDALFVLDKAGKEAALRLAKATLGKDEAILTSAQSMLRRDTALYQDHIISTQQLELQTATTEEDQQIVEADRAAVDTAQLDLSYTVISSPISGRAGLRQVDLGNVVKASDVLGLVSITQVNPITIIVLFPASRLVELADGIRAHKVHIDAWSDDDHQMLGEGQLITLDTSVDAGTGMFKAKGLCDNSHQRLWPGQIVHVRVYL